MKLLRKIFARKPTLESTLKPRQFPDGRIARKGWKTRQENKPAKRRAKLLADPMVALVLQSKKGSGLSRQECLDIKNALYVGGHKHCYYCKTKIQTNDNTKKNWATIEHLVPVAFGGSNRFDNLTLACQPCQQRTGSVTSGTIIGVRAKLASLGVKP